MFNLLKFELELDLKVLSFMGWSTIKINPKIKLQFC
jgi:hypothetical protein